MPYLNIDFNFPDHIKVRRLAGLIGGNAEAEGFIVRLWCHVGQHSGSTGTLAGYTEQEIEAVLRWSGEPGKLVAALSHVGLLRKVEGGFMAHDWLDHQGHIPVLKARAKAAAEARWSSIRNAKNSSADAPSIAPRTPKVGGQAMPHSFPSVPPKDKDKSAPPKRDAGGEIKIPADLLCSEKEINDWLAYKKQKRQPYKAGQGIDALWRRFREIPVARRRAAVDHSMANNWSGLFEPKEQNGGQRGKQNAGHAEPVTGKYPD